MLASFASSLRSTASSIRDGVQRYTAESRAAFEAEERRVRLQARREAREAGEGVPPWAAFSEDKGILEEEARARIEALCEEESTFTEDLLPEAYKAAFRMDGWAPMAAAALEAAPALGRRRFEIVPKRAAEDEFWARFFFAVARVRRELGLAELRPAEKPSEAELEEELRREEREEEERRRKERDEAEARDRERGEEEMRAMLERERKERQAEPPGSPVPRGGADALADDAQIRALEESLGKMGGAPAGENGAHAAAPVAAAAANAPEPDEERAPAQAEPEEDEYLNEFASDDPTNVDFGALGEAGGGPADEFSMESLDELLSGVDLSGEADEAASGSAAAGLSAADLEDEINASLREFE